MDRFTYESIRRKHPEMKFPAWLDLPNTDRHKVKRLTYLELLGRRAAALIRREPGQIDRKRKREYSGPWKRFKF